MCGRLTLTTTDLGEVARVLDARLAPGLPVTHRPRYNLAPTGAHVIFEGGDGGLLLEPARWGFPLGAQHAADPDDHTHPAAPARLVINARSEGVAGRPLFREPLAHRRCVVPADGFYEWRGPKGHREPLWFHPPGGGLLLMAGLAEDGPEGPRFVILTTAAGPDVVQVHDRMPALLGRSEARAWLAEPDLSLLRPAPEGTLAARPVSSRVNTVANDDPDCLAPAPPPRQLRLL